MTSKLYSKEEIFSKPSPIPKEPGVYAWFFKDIPSVIPAVGCFEENDLKLLYVGISPKCEPMNGAPPSSQRLYHRVRYHYSGNAEGSTLRLTLGLLLKDSLELELRRVGSGHRMTFAEGEKKLTQWMEENAFVKWIVCEKPWLLEEELIHDLSLPLNLDKNKHHCFYHVLSNIRREAKIRARELPVVASFR